MQLAHIGGKGWPKGVPRSPETVAKMSAAAKRQPMSEGFKAHQFKAGEPGLRKGQKHSPESIEKMREAHKGKPCPWKKYCSEDTREKLRAAQLGKPSPNKGKKMSDEMKKKLSESNKGKNSGSKHPNWRGGVSFGQYCEKFNNEFKERVRAFFGNHCVICGQVWHGGVRSYISIT